MPTSTAGLSLWWDTLGFEVAPRPALPGNADVDVAIVGGGFTGLWTARSLLEADPSLRVLIIEREVCGFGASGRNGGWASALFAAHDARIAREDGLDAARAMRTAMNASIDEIAEAARADGIDCDLAKGGTIVLARSAAQASRAAEEVAEARSLGFGAEHLRWLDAQEASALVGATSIEGATFTPHCAAIHPARLAVGLARAVEHRGATIVEGTSAASIIPGDHGTRPRVVTDRGTVTADVVVRATEAWTSQLPGSEREVIPVYSLMIATEPLPDEVLEQIGLADRQTFSDHRHLIIYGQRTADGRIAFGGRGAPYHFGSKIDPDFDRDAAVFSALRATLVELFPALADALVTHAWGGPLGIPRDWYSSVGLDRSTGLAWAGGYVGDGVTTTNLAGRTLADLITGTVSELTRLPWVGHRSKPWEPEPLRWIGVNTGLAAARWSDASEQRRGRPSKVAGALERFLGG
jgi:glycine/D-amino acid oxidase-like deaminating enzyme